MTVELACSQQSRNRHSLSFPVAYPLLNACPVIAFTRHVDYFRVARHSGRSAKVSGMATTPVCRLYVHLCAERINQKPAFIRGVLARHSRLPV